MRNNDWLFIFRSVPQEMGLSQDALDLMLVFAAFGVNINVIFTGEGVQHLLLGDTLSRDLPNYVKTFGALRDFEIDSVEIFDDGNMSINESSKYRLPIAFIDAKKMRQRLSEAHQIFNF